MCVHIIGMPQKGKLELVMLIIDREGPSPMLFPPAHYPKWLASASRMSFAFPISPGAGSWND